MRSTVKNATFMEGAAPRFSSQAQKSSRLADGPRARARYWCRRIWGRTFRKVVEGGTEVFYHGEIAKEIVRYSQENNGLITEKDLADFQVEWQDPISVPYKDYEVFCPPPPCSGFQYLETLNIIENDSPGELGHNSVEYLHLLIEAIKLASADRAEYTCAENPPITGLLSKDYASAQRKRIGTQPAVSGGERYTKIKLPGEVLPGDASEWINECTTHFGCG